MYRSKPDEIRLFLASLGFSLNEIEVYLKLLEIGSCTVSDLSRYLNTPRTNIHRGAERLIKKGFVKYSFRGKYKDLVPEDPEKLRKILINKKTNLNEQLVKVNNQEKKLNTLITYMNTSIPKSKKRIRIGVKYYEGREGAKHIYRQAFRAKELRSYVNLGKVHEVFSGE